MKAIVLMFVLIIFININFATAEPMEKNYGIVNAWFDGEEATVENIQLEVGEPVEIKVNITSKINGYISLKLTNPLVTESFKVVSGPSNIDEWIDISNIESGWTNTYIWVIEPTGKWTSGNAPIDIFVEFGTTYNDDEHYKFTIANPYILNEQYSGPTPTHTPTDPSSTDQPPGSNGLPGFGVVGALVGISLVLLSRKV
ncbi:MAG: sarcinarray family MAST domain-containing protein [Methanosarcinales archaeon]|nr:sarcinarray family MAST domain-containing protein [Methanosarcinales archaeon]